MFLPLHVEATGSNASDEIIHSAKQLKLAEHPAWLALLHYKKESIFGRFISQADDDRFFISDTGKWDPEAELVAAITAFLQPSQEKHAQCYFPARWHWLKTQLQLASFYDVSCPRFLKWMSTVSTDKLTLVFPSMYLGNPGSMFGHTFLRFDGKQSVLLEQAFNYAAAIDPEDSIFSYIYNGLFGGYNGVFQTRSYFETVQLYSHIENRDIWEYELDYSAEEVKQLARHVWEVSQADFDYFFFRENCAYRLLAMLDVMRPEAGLTEGNAFRFYAIPVDTVRALDEKKLIRARVYRPSLASQLTAAFTNTDDFFSQQVMAVAESKESVSKLIASIINEEQRSQVLDVAYTLLQFRQQAEGERGQAILMQRHELVNSQRDKIDPPVSPEQGHASARMALGGGQQNQRAYTDFLLRPAFHDLVDAPAGYVHGSEINVLDFRFRGYGDQQQLVLDSLRFFNIVSLNPVSDWYHPLSWQLDIKLERTWFDGFNSDMVLVTRAGGGYSVQLSNSTWFAMAMLEADVSNRYVDTYNALAGVQAGWLMLFDNGQLLVMTDKDRAFSGVERDKRQLRAEVQFNVTSRHALRLYYERTRHEFYEDKDWALRWQVYF